MTTLQALHESRTEGNYFFSRDTMKFFGDTMKNLGVVKNEDGIFIFRKRGKSAYWKFNEETYSISTASEELIQKHFK